MSKKQLNTKLPPNIRGEVEDFGDQHNLSRSEAARQLLKRGLDDWRDSDSEQPQPRPAERLLRDATSLSAVSAMVTAILIVVSGPVWAFSVAISTAAATLLFGCLWLGVRAVAGRETT